MTNRPATVALLCTIVMPFTASAHAFLETAIPAVGSTIRTAPAEVAITFTEGVEPAFSTIVVRDGSGADVTSGRPHLAGDDTRFAVPVRALPPGTYQVIWHVTAVDTHKTEGSFRFTVRP